MESLEQALRGAWYSDVGRNPEQTFSRLVDRFRLEWGGTCNLSSSHFNMSLQAMLSENFRHIRDQGERHNIDARAIVGAISWEYTENRLRGRLSDYFQFTWLGIGNPGLNSGLGWGSMHPSAIQHLRPSLSPISLQCQRMEAASSIELIAELMDEKAEQYFRVSKGVFIRNVPSILTMFYNTSDKFLAQSAQSHQLVSCFLEVPGVKLEIGLNPMALWVEKNLVTFGSFETSVIVPTAEYAQAVPI